MALNEFVVVVGQVIEDQYPQCEFFYESIHRLDEAARVSLVTLQTDVTGLRKGIDLILYEREKQQNNFVIYSFYMNAVQKVPETSKIRIVLVGMRQITSYVQTILNFERVCLISCGTVRRHSCCVLLTSCPLSTAIGSIRSPS